MPDVYEVAGDLQEAIREHDAFASAQILPPAGDTAGFVLDFPEGRYLVTVVEI